jgi:hypothetical protein
MSFRQTREKRGTRNLEKYKMSNFKNLKNE